MSAVNLNSLYLYYCGFTDELLRDILPKTNLKSLLIDDCKELTNENLVSLITSLQSLSRFRFNSKEYDIDCFAGALKKLEYLHLESPIPDSALHHLSSNLENLLELRLRHCLQITNDAFRNIHLLCNLKLLEVYNCPRITSTIFSFIKMLSSIHRLELDINMCTDGEDLDEEISMLKDIKDMQLK